MVVSAQDCASDALLFTWSAISSPGRQNSAIFDANHLAVGSETWVLKVAARRGFLRMDSGRSRIHPRKNPPCGHWIRSTFYENGRSCCKWLRDAFFALHLGLLRIQGRPGGKPRLNCAKSTRADAACMWPKGFPLSWTARFRQQKI